MKKRSITILSSFLLTFVIICNHTVAKYDTSSQNVLCDLILGKFTLVEESFTINQKDGGTSGILWGNGSSNGFTDSSNNLHSLGGRAFLVKNASGSKMKISLSIDFYLSWLNRNSSLDCSMYKVGVDSTYRCTMKSSGSGDGIYIYSQNGSLTAGYQCKTTIYPENLISNTTNSLISQQEVVDNFVMNNGETAAYHFSIDYNPNIDINLYSKYVAVKIVATPYE